MSAPTWVALLRGINVGASTRVAMADLRDLLGGLGHGEVRTLLQSGNAAFTAEDGTGRSRAGRLEAAISEAIASELALRVDVLVRTAAELAAVVEANPFVARGDAPRELHATFLASAPAAAAVAGLDPAAAAPDEFELGDRVVYERLANGVMGSRLPDWQRVLGITVTRRSWNTVERLHALATG